MSFVEVCGYNNDPQPCGYCKSKGSYSYGMYTWRLLPEDYQILMDRGWRRCGRYCYKMLMDKTCCPPYSIRCEALNFKTSRLQRRNLKRMYNFVVHGKVPKKKFQESRSVEEAAMSVEAISSMERDTHDNDFEKFSEQASAMSDLGTKKNRQQESCQKEVEKPPESTKRSTSEVTTLIELYPKPKKAKYKRMQRKLEKIMRTRKCTEKVAIETMLKKRDEKLSKAVKPFDKYFDYTSPKTAHNFEITFLLVSTAENYPGFQESYELYKKYQIIIHKDKPSELTQKSFENFLISNPYVNQKPFIVKSNKLPYEFGTYHMQYRLNGKLFAVGVLDVLPKSISSVYFYYDPDYGFLGLGKYSALREILLTRQMNSVKASIEYYYMGFYIHTCQKMKYKRNYFPSYLLCYNTLTWQPLEKCITKFQDSQYPILNDEPDALDQESLDITDQDIQVLLYEKSSGQPSKVTDFHSIKSLFDQGTKNLVYDYSRLVGKTLASRMYLFRTIEE